jgi:CBS domain containing-hemolysin-like protein
MSIQEDYRKAKVLASRGQYEDARKLLLPYDHAKTNALLQSVNMAILDARNQAQASERQQDIKRSNRTFLGVVLGIVTASVVTGFLGSWLYSAYDGRFTNAWLIILVFVLMWLAITAFISGIVRRV